MVYYPSVPFGQATHFPTAYNIVQCYAKHIWTTLITSQPHSTLNNTWEYNTIAHVLDTLLTTYIWTQLARKRTNYMCCRIVNNTINNIKTTHTVTQTTTKQIKIKIVTNKMARVPTCSLNQPVWLKLGKIIVPQLLEQAVQILIQRVIPLCKRLFILLNILHRLLAQPGLILLYLMMIFHRLGALFLQYAGVIHITCVQPQKLSNIFDHFHGVRIHLRMVNHENVFWVEVP